MNISELNYDELDLLIDCCNGAKASIAKGKIMGGMLTAMFSKDEPKEETEKKMKDSMQETEEEKNKIRSIDIIKSKLTLARESLVPNFK